MASPESSSETPALPGALSPTPNPSQEALDPGVTITLLEIRTLPAFRGSLSSLGPSGHQVAGAQAPEKFHDLLRDIKHILKNVADVELVTEAKASLEETDNCKDVSEAKGNLSGPDTTGAVTPGGLLSRSDPENQDEDAKQQGQGAPGGQLPASAGPASAGDSQSQSEAQSAGSKSHLRKEGGKDGSADAREASSELRANLEQLLREAEHWSRQHSELSELIRSYQRSQGPAPEGGVRRALEDQVRRLNRDTHSLHLLAALLASECCSLQRKVDILQEFRQPQEGLLRGSRGPGGRDRRPAAAEEGAGRGQSLPDPAQKPACVCRNSDPHLSKKACNDRLNACIARRARLDRSGPGGSLR
ncbi:spermatogenic leucine zipper protein 1 [Ctenodactylus gundi]